MSGRSPQISIGLPIYNGERYLRIAIESLLGQTFGDFELVISDNASSDATPDICQAYAREDRRIRYLRQPRNLGGPGNFSYVFRASRAPYFKWATANDVSAPTLLAACKAPLDAQPDVVLCYPRSHLIDARGTVLEDYEDGLDLPESDPAVRFREYLRRVRLNTPIVSGVFRSGVLARTRLLEAYQASDINLMAELALLGKFHEVPDRLYQRRIADDASTLNNSERENREFNLARPEKLLYFPAWQSQWAYLRSVSRVPLPWNRRLALYGFLAKYMYWDRQRLGRDLSAFARGLSVSLRAPG